MLAGLIVNIQYIHYKILHINLAFTRSAFNRNCFQVSIYLLKFNSGNIRAMCKICSKLTIKTPNDITDVVLVSLFLTLNRLHTLLWCFHCWLWTNESRLDLGDSNGIWTHNHLVRKRKLNHLASLAKWLSFRLRTKCLWVQIPLLSLELQILRLFRTKISLTFRQL